MSEHDSIDRRRILSGLGVIGGGALLAGTGLAGTAGAAGAAPAETGDSTTSKGRSSPAVSPISSGPANGVVYKFLSWADFNPETGTRAWTFGAGTYDATGGKMWATLDLPAGAVIKDIEWYFRSVTSTTCYARLWEAGEATVVAKVADLITTASASVQAVRVDVPTDSNGPYPHGTKLMLGIDTVNDGSVAINGARVGFNTGPVQFLGLTNPIRVYDSTDGGGALLPGASRTIDLGSNVPAGAAQALISFAIFNTVGTGTAKIGRAGFTPIANAAQWYGNSQKVTAPVTTRVDASGRVVVKNTSGSGRFDFSIDLIGHYA